jgi:hypothetical protein
MNLSLCCRTFTQRGRSEAANRTLIGWGSGLKTETLRFAFASHCGTEIGLCECSRKTLAVEQ